MKDLTQIANSKPSVKDQIGWVRKERMLLHRSIEVLDNPEDVKAYQLEVIMLREIEENLIAVQLQNEKATKEVTCSMCKTATEVLEPRQDNPLEKICVACSVNEAIKAEAGYAEEQPAVFTWPSVGSSVMVQIDNHGKTEWVDAYAINIPSAVGVVVKTFWGAIKEITNPANISLSAKEVSNG